MNFRDYLFEDIMGDDEDYMGASEQKRENFRTFPEQRKEGTRIAEILSSLENVKVEYQGWGDWEEIYYFNAYFDKTGYPDTFTAEDEKEAIEKYWAVSERHKTKRLKVA